MHGCGGNQDGALIESLGCIAAGDRETVPEAECKNAVIRMPKGEPGRKKAVQVLLFKYSCFAPFGMYAFQPG